MRPESAQEVETVSETAEPAFGSATTVIERPVEPLAPVEATVPVEQAYARPTEEAPIETIPAPAPVSFAPAAFGGSNFTAPDLESISEDGLEEDEGTPPRRKRPRRNPAKLWTAAAIAFCITIMAVGGALYAFGPPAWAVNLGLLPDDGEPDLIFYLAKPAERRKLPTGEEYFAFSARIVNSSERSLSVPPVVVELRDRQDRLVFSWTTKADKNSLKPGEEAAINESRLDIPKNAVNLSLGFVDPAGA